MVGLISYGSYVIPDWRTTIDGKGGSNGSVYGSKTCFGKWLIGYCFGIMTSLTITINSYLSSQKKKKEKKKKKKITITINRAFKVMNTWGCWLWKFAAGYKDFTGKPQDWDRDSHCGKNLEQEIVWVEDESLFVIVFGRKIVLH